MVTHRCRRLGEIRNQVPVLVLQVGQSGPEGERPQTLHSRPRLAAPPRCCRHRPAAKHMSHTGSACFCTVPHTPLTACVCVVWNNFEEFITNCIKNRFNLAKRAGYSDGVFYILHYFVCIFHLSIKLFMKQLFDLAQSVRVCLCK